MSRDDRLTDQELSWLLTQEAKSAAETLRRGVARLSLIPGEIVFADGPLELEPSLTALDDAMRMLDSLNARSAKGGTRGRFDLAALVVDIFPHARLRFEPGSGTEVCGNESDLRRMLQILVGHAGTVTGGVECPEVSIGREGDEVRVSVALGPEGGSSGGTERAWLGRTAMRHGGRLELEGGHESLVLPAEGVHDKHEIDSLRKELECVQKQGEACARELAALFVELGTRQSGVERAVVVGKALGGHKKQGASEKKMKILVVEAQESIRRMIEALVSGCVYEVTGVASGAKALEICMHEPPDLVLLDLAIPGPYDGMDVCRRIHKDPTMRAIPVVVISPTDDPVLRAKAGNAGVLSFHGMPWSPIALLNEIDVVRGRLGKR